jgi:hypothetical protein
MNGQWDVGDGRKLLGDNAATHQFPRSWNLDSNWSPFYIRIVGYTYTQMRLAPNHTCTRPSRTLTTALSWPSAGRQNLRTRPVRPFKHANIAHTLRTSSRPVMQLGTCKCRHFVLPGCLVETHRSAVIRCFNRVAVTTGSATVSRHQTAGIV